MGALQQYSIKEIPYAIAMETVVKNHYLHRKCPCSHAFGLFDGNGKLCGCVVYGVSCSSTLLKGICGEDEMQNVYELNRLWVADDVPKNGESYLISHTLKNLIRKSSFLLQTHHRGISGMFIKQRTFCIVVFLQNSKTRRLRALKICTTQHTHTE